MTGANITATPVQSPPRSRIRRTWDAFPWIARVLAVVYLVILLGSLASLMIRLFVNETGIGVIGEALSGRGVWDAVGGSAALLATAVPIAFVIGALFSWLVERTDANMGVLSQVLPLLPFFLPDVALAIGWIFLGSKNAGYINGFLAPLGPLFGQDEFRPVDIATWPGLVFVVVLALVPYAYLLISAALRNVDGARDEASRMSGAGLFRTLRRVSIPAIWPAIASAVLLMVVSCLAMFSIPTIIGTAADIDVLPVHIIRLIRNSFPPQLDEAVVLSGFILLTVGAVFGLQRLIASRARHSTIGGKGSRPTPIRLGPWKWVARAVMIVYLLLASVIPVLALLIVSLQPYWSPIIDVTKFSLKNLTDLFAPFSVTGKALGDSLALSVVGASLGIAIAAVLMVYVRQARGRFPRLLDASTKLPSAVTHIVLGVAFIASLGAIPFLRGTFAILLIAYIIVYMPQASIAAGSAADQIGAELSEASVMSGASAGRTFRKVTAPLMVPGLAAGWALLFVLMMGDLTVSALLAGNNTPVVGFVILSIWENGTYSSLSTLALLVALLSGLAVGVVLFLSRRLGLGRVV